MALRLNGSSSGYVELEVPADAGSHTLTLPDDGGTSGQYLQTNGSGTLSWQTVADTSTSVAVIADVKAADTNGGTFTSGAWRTRDLNTEIADADSIVSISSNQFTLIAGTYLIQYAAPAYAVSHHRARLYDVTNTAEIAQAVQGFAYPDPNLLGDYNTSIGSARVSITSSTTYEIQHICNTTRDSNGFGLGTDMAGTNCQYTTVTILRLG